MEFGQVYYINRVTLNKYGGEGEIRTRGTPKEYNGFRGRRLQPLGHLSADDRIVVKSRVCVGF